MGIFLICMNSTCTEYSTFLSILHMYSISKKDFLINNIDTIIMYTDGYVRVITEQPLVGSVPLAELLGDDNWVNAVKASHLSNYYLSNVKYEEFISHSESRVLSYRWKNKISLDCVVSDPAGILSRFRGDIALSVLETPLGEWKYLWADALNHLNDPEGEI